jgi:hypothetical protein
VSSICARRARRKLAVKSSASGSARHAAESSDFVAPYLAVNDMGTLQVRIRNQRGPVEQRGEWCPGHGCCGDTHLEYGSSEAALAPCMSLADKVRPTLPVKASNILS